MKILTYNDSDQIVYDWIENVRSGKISLPVITLTFQEKYTTGMGAALCIFIRNGVYVVPTIVEIESHMKFFQGAMITGKLNSKLEIVNWSLSVRHPSVFQELAEKL
jgi:hypothetical protein